MGGVIQVHRATHNSSTILASIHLSKYAFKLTPWGWRLLALLGVWHGGRRIYDPVTIVTIGSLLVIESFLSVALSSQHNCACKFVRKYAAAEIPHICVPSAPRGLYNKYRFNHSTPSTQLLKAHIAVISKPRKEPSFCGSYYPISLLEGLFQGARFPTTPSPAWHHTPRPGGFWVVKLGTTQQISSSLIYNDTSWKIFFYHLMPKGPSCP